MYQFLFEFLGVVLVWLQRDAVREHEREKPLRIRRIRELLLQILEIILQHLNPISSCLHEVGDIVLARLEL